MPLLPPWLPFNTYYSKQVIYNLLHFQWKHPLHCMDRTLTKRKPHVNWHACVHWSIWLGTNLIIWFSPCSKSKWNNAHGLTRWDTSSRQLLWYLYILMNMYRCSLLRCQDPPTGKFLLHVLAICSYVFFNSTEENLVLITDNCVHIITTLMKWFYIHSHTTCTLLYQKHEFEICEQVSNVWLTEQFIDCVILIIN